MLDGSTILVAGDDYTMALDMSLTVLRSDGKVFGPASTAIEALSPVAVTCATGAPLAGAILGGKLADRDVAPVVLVLHACSVPVIIYSDDQLPSAVAALIPPVCAVPRGDINRAVAVLKEAIASRIRTY